ncbi:MAG: hypothetical protein U5K37_04690 [Natrialbaceae archaeon]|nr:hypothetical protein [Natrialbaceae archaeon]
MAAPAPIRNALIHEEHRGNSCEVDAEFEKPAEERFLAPEGRGAEIWNPSPLPEVVDGNLACRKEDTENEESERHAHGGDNAEVLQRLERTRDIGGKPEDGSDGNDQEGRSELVRGDPHGPVDGHALCPLFPIPIDDVDAEVDPDR